MDQQITPPPIQPVRSGENASQEEVQTEKAPETLGVRETPTVGAPVSNQQNQTTQQADISAVKNIIDQRQTNQSGLDQQQVASVLRSDPDALVKQAEEIIKEDKGDPYKEEEDLEDVQIEYLKTRFGKDIKKS